MIVADPVKAVGVKIISFVDSASTSANIEMTVSHSNVSANPVASSGVSVESNVALSAASSMQNFQTVQPPIAMKNQSLDQMTGIPQPAVAAITQNLPGIVQPPVSAHQSSVSVVSHTASSNTTTTTSITTPVPAPVVTTSTTKTSRFLVTKSTLPVDISSSSTLPSLSSNLQEHTFSKPSLQTNTDRADQVLSANIFYVIYINAISAIPIREITTVIVSHMDNYPISEPQAKDAPPVVTAASNSTSAPLINPVNTSAVVLQHAPNAELRTTLKKLESELCKVSGVNAPNNIPSVMNSGSVPPLDLPGISGGSLPCASLPHTPSISSNLTHNLTGLNDKLLALSQKMQNEQMEEVAYSGNEAVASVAQHSPGITPGLQNASTAPVIPTTLPNIVSGTVTPGKTSATPEAGILHVDTLNELADALQKVIHFEPRETGSVPPPGVDITGHIAPLPTEHQSPSTTDMLHAAVTNLQDISSGVDRAVL
ncbi:unnamed protein product [Onchocerca flexuosa]|uniref:Flocculation protein FLO11-like n=1 Tax=Onchocerca flexuosa TaxID=387005 RepID=A0A183HAP0_9BILA|nr:unnamed protein product [Onchocerca flexuosa]